MIKSTSECAARQLRRSAGAICLGIALASLGAVGCGHKGADRDAATPSDTTGSTGTSGTGGTTGTGDTNMNGTGDTTSPGSSSTGGSGPTTTGDTSTHSNGTSQ
jgi:hypothetical protein